MTAIGPLFACFDVSNCCASIRCNIAKSMINRINKIFIETSSLSIFKYSNDCSGFRLTTVQDQASMFQMGQVDAQDAFLSASGMYSEVGF
ncbi:MAG: hypothetical protein ABFR19_00330 [Pseudomonadota bacterium]